MSCRSIGPKVVSTFGTSPMLLSWTGASFKRKTGPTFPHDALSSPHVARRTPFRSVADPPPSPSPRERGGASPGGGDFAAHALSGHRLAPGHGRADRGRAGARLCAEARLPAPSPDVLRPGDRGAGARPAMGRAAHRRGHGTGGPQRH